MRYILVTHDLLQIENGLNTFWVVSIQASILPKNKKQITKKQIMNFSLHFFFNCKNCRKMDFYYSLTLINIKTYHCGIEMRNFVLCGLLFRLKY